MYEDLTMPRLLNRLEQVSHGFPDTRTGGPNPRYEITDAALGALAVFFTQEASFLAHQTAMKLAKGRSNAERLFALHALPSDNQIRNLLDPVSPKHLWPIYRYVFPALDGAGVLQRYRSHARQLLVVMDGTQYFSSKTIHCPNCSQRVLSNGQTQYFHSVLTPVVVQAGNPHVLALKPEFIVPQDGHEKQDSEITAAKRWLEQHGDFYARQEMTGRRCGLLCITAWSSTPPNIRPRPSRSGCRRHRFDGARRCSIPPTVTLWLARRQLEHTPSTIHLHAPSSLWASVLPYPGKRLN
jgi:hypothetical protein